MIKYAIRFPDGMYWRAYQQDALHLADAWHFNKSHRALQHAEQVLGIQGAVIVSYQVS